MSFNVALSGLNGASKDLAATGNNIANASTVGFKKSRVEFGDLYTGGFLTNGATAVGSGVRVQEVRQLHSQGNVTATDNGLDMAISGEGYFVLNNGGETRYSRAGQFGLSQDGYLQNNQGMRVQGYQPDGNGGVNAIRGDLRVETDNLPPRATLDVDGRSGVSAGYNLDSRLAPPATAPFDINDSGSFSYTNSTSIYDSLGNPHTLTQYFVKGEPNEWSLYTQVDDQPASAGQTLTFTDGVLPAGTTVPVAATMTNGAANIGFSLDLSGSTQFGAPSGLSSLSQTGYTTGRLTGLDVSDEGNIFGRYSNGRTDVLGQVALANFGNPEGLAPVGETTWVESIESGAALIDRPGTGSLGSVKAGSVEDSNVDLSQQLVSLIVAQRNFQANAKTIETSDAITQTIINLR